MTDDSVKREFMEMYGMQASVLDDIISLSFDLLGLGMFFTMGKTEVRAWATEKGSTAKYGSLFE
jgi:ribosome-binding ATPase YchF (GTP1/OBG family)